MDCSHRDLGRFEGVCGEADGGVMRDTLLVLAAGGAAVYTTQRRRPAAA